MLSEKRGDMRNKRKNVKADVNTFLLKAGKNG